jgi:hypothetical protein
VFLLLHYTSKNEKKGHECSHKKKNHRKLPIEKKKKNLKDACNKNTKKQEIQEVVI